jgi:hypothetical protein
MGAILFFLGMPLLILSWYNSYPIRIGSLDSLTFTQFSPLIWPGILLTSFGLFVTGYFSPRNSVKALCAAIFPVSVFSYVLFFNGTATSDIGNAKSMFDVFHAIGINPSEIRYFHFPAYFTFNEATAQLTGMDANSIAMIFFGLFGVLLGLFSYLFLFRVTKYIGSQVALLGVFLYFSISFSFLNYQWVPQTLALIFFFLLLILITLEGTKYKIFTLVIFIVLMFTHLFIPIIFLLFFGLYTLKKKESFRLFLILTCLYAAILAYYTSFYIPQLVDTFMNVIYGFEEYRNTLAQSFKNTSPNFFDQLISNINRVRVPITIGILALGFAVGLFKKKIHYIILVLGIVGGLYLVLGLVYPVLGWRALQVLILALVAGIGFLIGPRLLKKPTMVLVTILIVLSIFGPLRFCYDQTQFILDEEETSCRFLSTSIPAEKDSFIGVDQVVWGYFSNIAEHIDNGDTITYRPSNENFYKIFNNSMKSNNYIIYNSNLGKELRDAAVTKQNVYEDVIRVYRQSILKTVLLNNKIYSCGETYIITG